jgi:Ca-activated chloride channel family protein
VAIHGLANPEAEDPRIAQPLGDLFVGRPVLLHGRDAGEGRTKVKVSGNVGGKRITMKIDVDLDATVKRESLPLIWARSEIQHIADSLAREADDSLESRGLNLALNYNLVSDWTSFVAVDASEVVEEPGDRTETVPVPVPDGVKYDTTVGGR